MSRPDQFPNCMALSSKMEPCLGYSEVRTKLDLEEKENERLRQALRYFVGCSYPVASEINPRGHSWRGEEALDFALSEAKSALGD